MSLSNIESRDPSSFDLAAQNTEPNGQAIEQFKSTVAKADGTLIALRKTVNGRKIYVCVRHAQVDEKPISGVSLISSIMAVNVYSQTNDGLNPIGHIDWWFNGDYANGGANQQKHFVPVNGHEQAAIKKYKSYAFRVDDAFSNQDIGSFMVATSAVALPAIGAKTFFTGLLMPGGVKTYKRFGIMGEDFVPEYKGINQLKGIPIEKLSQSPQVNRVLTEFV